MCKKACPLRHIYCYWTAVSGCCHSRSDEWWIRVLLLGVHRWAIPGLTASTRMSTEPCTCFCHAWACWCGHVGERGKGCVGRGNGGGRTRRWVVPPLCTSSAGKAWARRRWGASPQINAINRPARQAPGVQGKVWVRWPQILLSAPPAVQSHAHSHRQQGGWWLSPTLTGADLLVFSFPETLLWL